MANRKTTRRKKATGSEPLTWFGERELLYGMSGAIDPFPDDGAMRAAWEHNRDALREKWRAKNRPGTRCFAEWLFEIVPEHGERQTTERWAATHERNRANWLKHGILNVDTIPGLQEPQHEFLFRHGAIDYGEYEEAKALHQERLDDFTSSTL